MKEVTKQVMDERFEVFVHYFEKAMLDEKLKPLFEMMSMHQKADILSHVINGMLIGRETQEYFALTNAVRK